MTNIEKLKALVAEQSQAISNGTQVMKTYDIRESIVLKNALDIALPALIAVAEAAQAQKEHDDLLDQWAVDLSDTSTPNWYEIRARQTALGDKTNAALADLEAVKLP